MKFSNSSETHHRPGQCDQGLEERVKGGSHVFLAIVTFQTFSVESDVPVGDLIDETQQTTDDGI